MGRKQIQEIEEKVELEIEYLKAFQGTLLDAYSVSVIIEYQETFSNYAFCGLWYSFL